MRSLNFNEEVCIAFIGNCPMWGGAHTHTHTHSMGNVEILGEKERKLVSAAPLNSSCVARKQLFSLQSVGLGLLV